MPNTGYRYCIYQEERSSAEYDPEVYLNLDEGPCNDTDCANQHAWVYDEPRPDPITVISITAADIFNSTADPTTRCERIIKLAMEQPDPLV